MPNHRLPAFCMLSAFCAFVQISSASAQATSRAGSGHTQFSLSEYEGDQGRASWQFNDSVGTGAWDDGETAVLIITGYSRNADNEVVLTIHRVDTGGKNRGYTADYKATVVDGQMAGTFRPSEQGKPEGVWHAVPTEDNASHAMPPYMRLCEVTCVMYRYSEGAYRGVGSPPWPDWSDTITVIELQRNSVVLRRKLTGQVHFTVTYRGKIGDDGNSVVGIVNPFYGGKGQPQYTSITFNPPDNTGSPAQQGITLDQFLHGVDSFNNTVNSIKFWYEVFHSN
jgi:hypothetical protein